jgi:hypothetical protein
VGISSNSLPLFPVGHSLRQSELPVVDQVESTKSQRRLTVGMTCNFSFAAVREKGKISSLKNPIPKCQ